MLFSILKISNKFLFRNLLNIVKYFNSSSIYFSLKFLIYAKYAYIVTFFDLLYVEILNKLTKSINRVNINCNSLILILNILNFLMI